MCSDSSPCDIWNMGVKCYEIFLSDGLKQIIFPSEIKEEYISEYYAMIDGDYSYNVYESDDYDEPESSCSRDIKWARFMAADYPNDEYIILLMESMSMPLQIRIQAGLFMYFLMIAIVFRLILSIRQIDLLRWWNTLYIMLIRRKYGL